MDKLEDAVDRATDEFDEEIRKLAKTRRRLLAELTAARKRRERQQGKIKNLSDEEMVILLVTQSGKNGLHVGQIQNIFKILGRKTLKSTISSYITRAKKKKIVSRLPGSARWAHIDSIRELYPNADIDKSGVLRERPANRRRLRVSNRNLKTE